MNKNIKIGDRVKRKAFACWPNAKNDERIVTCIWKAGRPPKTFATLDDGSSSNVESLLLAKDDSDATGIASNKEEEK